MSEPAVFLIHGLGGTQYALGSMHKRLKNAGFVTHSITEAVALSDRVLVSSPRPARIIADIHIDLARPRPDDVEDQARFFELCNQVRHALHEGAKA